MSEECAVRLCTAVVESDSVIAAAIILFLVADVAPVMLYLLGRVSGLNDYIARRMDERRINNMIQRRI